MTSPRALAVARMALLMNKRTPPISASTQLAHNRDGRKILRRINNGPGMHLYLAFSAGGVLVEAAFRWAANLLGLGPDAAANKIEEILGPGSAQLNSLDALHALRLDPPATCDVDEKSKTELVRKLSTLCKKLLKYTDRYICFLLRRAVKATLTPNPQITASRDPAYVVQVHRQAHHPLHRAAPIIS